MKDYDKILYGRDPEECIVGAHKHGEETVRLYIRDLETDKVSFRDEKAFPFFFTTDEGERRLRTLPAGMVKVRRLNGDLYYNHIVVAENSSDIWKARQQLTETQTDEAIQNDLALVLGGIVSQYLAQSGKTFFKGMTTATAKRMQLDIETISSTKGVSNAKRVDDEIVIIAMSDNRGWDCILHTSEAMKDLPAPYVWCESEEWMLIEMVKTIQRQDPDIIEGHNIFGFDLPYIRERCKLHGVNFAIGRDRRAPRFVPSSKKFAERDFEYDQCLIAGRAVIDTMFLAVDWDVLHRDLPGLGLKAVAKHFGVAREGRVYVEGDAITETWKNDPAKLLEYALDDVHETRGIAEILCASQFALAQMCPLDYQTIHTGGKAAIIESLFTREYLRQRHSLPKPEVGKQEHGGYTDIFKQGVYDDCAYADVLSLYPSIMLNYNVQPESDVLLLFQYLLRRLTELRIAIKNEMYTLKLQLKETTDSAFRDRLEAQIKELDARQSAYKTIINSFYGMLSYVFGLFNDYSEGDRVALTGQGLLKRMFQIIRSLGGDPILCDTDGILFQIPKVEEVIPLLPAEHREPFLSIGSQNGRMSDQQLTYLIETVISERMPKGISVENDGRYERVLSFKKKNYIIRTYEGKVKVKGGSLKSRGIEPFGRKYIEEVALALLDRDVLRVSSIHDRYKRMIATRDWTPDDFCKRATLKKSLGEYVTDVEDEDKKSNRAAQYELALQLQQKYGKEVFAGDTIEYYIAGDKAHSTVRAFVDSKLKAEWVPGDENVRWYLKRLRDFSKKFEPFFEKEDFGKVFAVNPRTAELNLFQSSIAHNIRIKNTVVKIQPD